MSDSKLFEKATRTFLSLFSRKEVKTPLSFFFRVVTAISALSLAVAILLRGDANLIFKVFEAGILVFVFLFVAVYVFAWFNPTNLVYGETAYRAERRLSMGTEQKELAADEVETLQGQTNPALPSIALPRSGTGGGA